jgi:hypothetical protein
MFRLFGRMGVLFVALVSVVSLACNAPVYPQDPLPNYTANQADADSLESALAEAANTAAQTNQFTVTVTEAQLTSWLTLYAPTYAAQQGFQFPVRNPKVTLQNGQIRLFGLVSQPNVPETAAQLIVVPSVDANGQLSVSIQGGQFGVAGIPQDMLNNLNTQIRDTLLSVVSQVTAQTGASYRITGLNIANGAMTLSGQIVY